MNKASIVKDAISYIQELQEEERKLTAEVAEVEAANERSSRSSPLLAPTTSIEVMEVKWKRQTLCISSLVTIKINIDGHLTHAND